MFSETTSYGRTHFAIWDIKHYLTLLVKSIQDHGLINFQTWGNFSRIYVDSHRVTLELSRDPNVIILAS